jgi:hypothetical protein
MRMIVLATALVALVGCDSPWLHQDRPGGTDYHPPYGSNQSYPTSDQVAQARRDCDDGNRAACEWIRQGKW